MDIKWQCLNIANELVEFKPVAVEQVGVWETEEDLFRFLGTASSMSRLSDTGYEACRKRVLGCIKKGHHSVLEHANFSVIIDCDRGTTHAIVRHRHCAFTQSSTVYGKISDKLTVTSLPFIDPVTGNKVQEITPAEIEAYEWMQIRYKELSKTMWAERTRDHLPTSFHSRIFMTTNLREWIYFIQRRKDPTTSVRIHCIAVMLEELFEKQYPVIYKAMLEWYEKHPL